LYSIGSVGLLLSLRNSAPDKSGNGNDGGDDKQPPDEPYDANKHERSHNDTKEYSD